MFEIADTNGRIYNKIFPTKKKCWSTSEYKIAFALLQQKLLYSSELLSCVYEYAHTVPQSASELHSCVYEYHHTVLLLAHHKVSI